MDRLSERYWNTECSLITQELHKRLGYEKYDGAKNGVNAGSPIRSHHEPPRSRLNFLTVFQKKRLNRFHPVFKK
jgi:hypothetical protein